LYWYFKQQRIDFIAVGKGGAQPNISQTIINNASIVVPNEKVQDKIVKFLERIEKGDGIDYDFFIPEVLKDVETIYKYKNSYETLSDCFETQLTLLDQLNQAILQEAVQGKLVPQDPNDLPDRQAGEPASELLKRIKKERQKSLPAGAKRRQEKPLPPIKPEEIPFDIPKNWVWCRLGDVMNVKSGKRIHAADYRKEGVPFLRSGEIGTLGRGEKLKSELYISREKYEDIKTKFGIPKEGDILIACIGGSIGNTWVVDDREFYYKDGNLVLIESIPEVETNFLLTYLKSPFFWKNTILKATDSSYNALTIEKLKDAEFPLPPLFEQKRIVAEIERQLAKTKQLREHIIANQQATEQLLKALLHQAFEAKENEENLAKA
jgi:type I restriction enzyme S subunit